MSSTADVAKQLVELCRKGENLKAIQLLYAQDVVSVEASEMPNLPREMHGLDAVMKKSQWWIDNHTINSASASDPFLAKDKFAVIFDYDVTEKQTGKRHQMEELGVYTVDDGKVVREEFIYKA